MKFKKAQWIAAREEIGCCPFFRKEITAQGRSQKSDALRERDGHVPLLYRREGHLFLSFYARLD